MNNEHEDTEIKQIIDYFKSLPVINSNELDLDECNTELMFGCNKFIEDGMNKLYLDEKCNYISARILNDNKSHDPDSYLFKIDREYTFNSHIYSVTNYMNKLKTPGDKFEFGMLGYDDSGFGYMSVLTEDFDEAKYEYSDDDEYHLTDNFISYLIENKLVPESLYL